MTDNSDPLILLAVLELYAHRKQPSCLALAQRLGQNILADRFHKGFFTPSPDRLYAKFDDLTPLALLRLVAVIRGRPEAVPAYWGSRPRFHCTFDGLGRTYDTMAIYPRTR